MKLDNIISRKIEKYGVEGNLDHTSKFFLFLANARHNQVKAHSQRVALLSEYTAIELNKDAKAAFFGGLLHDVGKIVLPDKLFDGHNIDQEEYEEVKTHALFGFEILKEMHLFTALCAGLHHAIYKKGYGLSTPTLQKFLPKGFSLESLKKILEISTIISICDFVDAYTNRKTEIKDGSDKTAKPPSLVNMLKEKYPNDRLTVDTALEGLKKVNFGC
jgi:putative nucleotidyltransferase with HDIG domain